MKESNCQPSFVPRHLANRCSSCQMPGSNCQRGNLKPLRRFETPMQRPALIQACIVTPLVPASTAAASMVIMSAASSRSRRCCMPDRSSAVDWAADTYRSERRLDGRTSVGIHRGDGQRFVRGATSLPRRRRIGKTWLGRIPAVDLGVQAPLEIARTHCTIIRKSSPCGAEVCVVEASMAVGRVCRNGPLVKMNLGCTPTGGAPSNAGQLQNFFPSARPQERSRAGLA